MFDYLRMIFRLLYEASREGRLIDILHDQVWNRKVLVPTEMDLSALPTWKDPFQELGYQFIELTAINLQSNGWFFSPPSRRFKALRNLKRGLRGFALIKDSKVLGDLWCLVPKEEENPVAFRDLDMVGIKCKVGEAYAFDMLITPDSRGKNLAVPFQRSLCYTLKSEGVQKVFGYFWEENIPAMWMHRMLKYKELPKREVSRFFFFMRAKTVTLKESSKIASTLKR
jgi:hypothetical protein